MEATLETKNYSLSIEQDNSPESPREWNDLTKMVCFHSRYNLGDKHDYNHNDYNGWDEIEKAIIKNENVAVILNLYLYDHSGITISTSPFGCRWDSGQIGFIYITKEDAIANWGKKICTKEVKEKALKFIEGDVKTYDDYLVGNVHGFTLTNKVTDEEDSCWGFFGDDFWETYMHEHFDNDALAELYPYLKAEYGKNEKVEKQIENHKPKYSEQLELVFAE